MKHLFLINPAAGKTDSTFHCTSQIKKLCQNLDYEIFVSKQPGELTNYARKAAQTGEEIRLYACGGDGTLNEVVNGVVGCPNAAITSWPVGSGNDFVRVFSDPSRFRNLEDLLDAEEASIDLIRCGNHYAINICSMGIDARIASEMINYKRIPLLSGFGSYLVSTLVNVIKGIHEPYVVEINGETIDSNQTLICICSGRYYGGGFNPVPDSELDDGELEVLMIKPISRLRVANLIGAYKAGKYKEMPNWIKHYSTQKISIHCKKNTVVNLDGEARWATDVTFEVCPQALRFFYPRGLDFHSVKDNAPTVSI